VVVAGIRIYPVKSLGGVDVERAEVEPWGLRHDRRWALTDPDGLLLTAREQHTMLSVTAVPFADGSIELRRNRASLRVEPPVDGEPMPLSISRLDTVRHAGNDADAFLSEALRRPVRLGWLDDPRRRSVSAEHGGLPGDTVNLNDTAPLLVTTDASLRRLNDWIVEEAVEHGEEPPEALPMIRFRPNVIVAGCDQPFAEDDWSELRIGEVPFRFSEHCDRCVLTTIDPETLVGGKEPLRTLARHRRWAGKAWFGARFVPRATGVIGVGDAIGAAG